MVWLRLEEQFSCTSFWPRRPGSLDSMRGRSNSNHLLCPHSVILNATHGRRMVVERSGSLRDVPCTLTGQSPCCHRKRKNVSLREYSAIAGGVDKLAFRRFINIHLLNLLDGSPHELPLRKVLSLNLEAGDGHLVVDKQISGSRIAFVIEHHNLTGRCTTLIAWDWRTGEAVTVFYCF